MSEKFRFCPDHGREEDYFCSTCGEITTEAILLESRSFVLNELEVQSLIKALEHEWISHDNPLASQVLTKMIKFVGDK